MESLSYSYTVRRIWVRDYSLGSWGKNVNWALCHPLQSLFWATQSCCRLYLKKKNRSWSKTTTCKSTKFDKYSLGQNISNLRLLTRHSSISMMGFYRVSGFYKASFMILERGFFMSPLFLSKIIGILFIYRERMSWISRIRIELASCGSKLLS